MLLNNTFWSMTIYSGHPQSIKIVILLRLILLPTLAFYFYRIPNCFHGTFATSVTCHQENLTLPYTWFPSPLGTSLCITSIFLRQAFPPKCLDFPDFIHTSYSYFTEISKCCTHRTTTLSRLRFFVCVR